MDLFMIFPFRPRHPRARSFRVHRLDRIHPRRAGRRVDAEKQAHRLLTATRAMGDRLKALAMREGDECA